MCDKSVFHMRMQRIGARIQRGFARIIPDMHIPVPHTNPVIATHTGKDAFAIMYYVD